MKSVIRLAFSGRNKVSLDKFNLPDPKKNEILIKTHRTLISTGTELAILTGTHPGFKDSRIGYPPTPYYPFYPGYSNAGEVVEIGNKVKSFKVGDRVVSWAKHASHVMCVEEPWCVQRIPAQLNYDIAVFSSLALIAMYSIRVAHICLGESVMILGQGLVGQLSLQLAKLAGARLVAASDLYDDRLSISQLHGAEYVFNPSHCDICKEIEAITGKDGVDVTIEATGSSDQYSLAFKTTRVLGRIVVLGCPKARSNLNLYPDLQRKGLSLTGAHVDLYPIRETNQYPWTRQKDWRWIVDLLSRDQLRVSNLITHNVNYKDAPDIYEQLRTEPGRILGAVIDWSEYRDE